MIKEQSSKIIFLYYTSSNQELVENVVFQSDNNNMQSQNSIGIASSSVLQIFVAIMQVKKLLLQLHILEDSFSLKISFACYQ